ncbi:MAG TPA: hypothetical protein VHL57_07410 [Flavobacteriales bacterium]|jgi:hypothetical protein|nr:hypothetical protein [Flavobacteriales bacterium]
MKTVFFLLIPLFVAACSTPEQPKEDTSARIDSATEAATDPLPPIDEYADLFVTIADTGRDFDALTKTMMHLSQATGAVEMERPINHYIPERDSLMVPPDTDDDIYRGSYCLRRAVDTTMTVEYLDAYDTAAPPRTMAVVTGIWATRAQADSVLRAQAAQAPVPMVLAARLYQGCIH